jgi:hypothetical protein
MVDADSPRPPARRTPARRSTGKDPEEPWYTRAWAKVTETIKIPTGGVVSKLVYSMVAICLWLSLMAAIIHTETVGIVALICITVIVLWLGSAIIWLSHKHPQAALYEGEQYLTHEQMQLGVKQAPVLTVKVEDLTAEPPALPAPPGVPDSPSTVGPPAEHAQDKKDEPSQPPPPNREETSSEGHRGGHDHV